MKLLLQEGPCEYIGFKETVREFHISDKDTHLLMYVGNWKIVLGTAFKKHKIVSIYAKKKRVRVFGRHFLCETSK